MKLSVFFLRHGQKGKGKLHVLDLGNIWVSSLTKLWKNWNLCLSIPHCPDFWALGCFGWIGVNSSYLWDTFLRTVNVLQCRRGKCCISQFHLAGKCSLCPFNCWWKTQLQIKVFTFLKSSPLYPSLPQHSGSNARVSRSVSPLSMYQRHPRL